MPFKKGQSGNPSGRPKESGLLRDLARESGPEAIEKLIELMRGDDKRMALQASQALLDRGYGKPLAPIEHSGSVTLTYDQAVLALLEGEDVGSTRSEDTGRPEHVTH